METRNAEMIRTGNTYGTISENRDLIKEIEILTDSIAECIFFVMPDVPSLSKAEVSRTTALTIKEMASAQNKDLNALIDKLNAILSEVRG